MLETSSHTQKIAYRTKSLHRYPSEAITRIAHTNEHEASLLKDKTLINKSILYLKIHDVTFVHCTLPGVHRSWRGFRVVGIILAALPYLSRHKFREGTAAATSTRHHFRSFLAHYGLSSSISTSERHSTIERTLSTLKTIQF